SQEQDYRPSLRSRPRARQQGQGERQDTTQNCRLEPGFPARNPSTQMTVNLDSVPCALSSACRLAVRPFARVRTGGRYPPTENSDAFCRLRAQEIVRGSTLPNTVLAAVDWLKGAADEIDLKKTARKPPDTLRAAAIDPQVASGVGSTT